MNRAWQLVVHKLRTHGKDVCFPKSMHIATGIAASCNNKLFSFSGRLRVKEEYLIPAITTETPLEYIIPTTTEAGACTTALVDFLTLTHNDFIERCRSLVSSQEQRYSYIHNHACSKSCSIHELFVMFIFLLNIIVALFKWFGVGIGSR